MFKLREKLLQKRIINEIKKFNLNWEKFYQINKISSSLHPIDYFVKNVEKEDLIVPDVLNVNYYLKTYPDVKCQQVNPLIHYLKYGKKENRLAFPSKTAFIPKLTPEQIQHDYSVIISRNYNWQTYIHTHSLSSVEEAVAHYVNYWPTLLPYIEGVIDTSFYINTYPDVWELGENPLVHYIEYGSVEGRQAFPEQIEALDSNTSNVGNTLIVKEKKFNNELQSILNSLNVDWTQFYRCNQIEKVNVDPIQFIVEKHDTMMLKIPRLFDGKLYLELYPDIGNAGVSPLWHYLFHGRAEGRIGYFSIEEHFCLGKYEFDESKPLFVIACHESSATGAPLVGFNLAQQLSKQYNIVNIILKESKLQKSFENECIASISGLHVQSPVLAKLALDYITKKFKNIEGIICNSVETAYVLEAANTLNVPSVSLVHEFSEYTRPVGKITNTVFNADRVIVPAQVIKDSMCRELESFRGIKTIPNNIVVQPQGRLFFIPEGHGKLDSLDVLKKKLGLNETNKDCHILVGAGYVQIRKGVDLFVTAAKRIKELCDKPCKFVWVGEGYQPKTDLNYSNWIQTQITLNKLGDDIVFLGHQRNLDNIMELADVFCMTSRLDPFPNVVIDALDADVHVACFEQSTGCAQFLKEHNANATVADYLDIESFSHGVSNYLNNSQRFLNQNKQIVKQYLDFDKYTMSIINELNNAKEFRKEVKASYELIEQFNVFDAQFYDETLTPESALKEYIRLGLKGIHLYNPAPGFNERVWLANNEQYNVALAEALKAGKKQTHNVVVLYDDKSETINFRYAVHLHLFYLDLAAEFAEYFTNLPKGFDLFITHLDKENEKVIKRIFKKCGAENVYLYEVENKGRDVAPFIDIMRPHVDANEYEVIGHFHSKKSLEVGGCMGDLWRSFLLDTLIGTSNQSSQVMALFNDAEVGMVFAEDRHCVDSGDNIEFIKALYAELDIEADTNCYLYPLGTMFWARNESIKPLFRLPKEYYQLDEPLPYDGSYLHSIERILSVVSINKGFNNLTISTPKVSW